MNTKLTVLFAKIINVLVFAIATMCFSACSESKKNISLVGRWEVDMQTAPLGFAPNPHDGGAVKKYRIDITDDVFTFRLDVFSNEFNSSIYSLQSPWNYDGKNLVIKDHGGNEISIGARVTAEGRLVIDSHPGDLSGLIIETGGTEDQLGRHAAARSFLKIFQARARPPIALMKSSKDPAIGDLSSP